MSTEPRQLAVLKSYADVVQTLRARRDELDVPQMVLDEITGLAAGHVSHLLQPHPMKLIGPVSWNLFEALGIRIIAVEDLRALARAMRSSAWRTRRQPQPIEPQAYPQAPGRITPANAVEMALRRAAALSSTRRAAIARKAAKARWRGSFRRRRI
jgi:hypothetical protein